MARTSSAGGLLDGFAQTVDELAVQRVAALGALHLQGHHVAVAGHTNHGASLYSLHGVSRIGALALRDAVLDDGSFRSWDTTPLDVDGSD